MDLLNRVALITGGARIGISVAAHLASRGCSVAMTYRRSKKAADEASMLIEKYGSEAFTVRCDVSKPAQAARCVKSVVRKFGRLDVLINMASDYEQTPLKSLTERDWSKLMASNAAGVFNMTMAAVPHLKKAKGRIINFSDWVAASGRPRYKNYVPYYSAKTAVIGLTQSLALELAPDILVNAIAPGPILPPSNSSRSVINDVKKATPLGRWGGADEIAKTVLFFCDSDFVTGETIRVDGGRHLF